MFSFSPKIKHKQPLTGTGPVRLNRVSLTRLSLYPQREDSIPKTLNISELNTDSIEEVELNEQLSPFGVSSSAKRRKSGLGIPRRLGANPIVMGTPSKAIDLDIDDLSNNKENSKSIDIDYTENFKLSGNQSNSNRSSTSSIHSNLSNSNGHNANANSGFRRVSTTDTSKRKSFISFGSGGCSSSSNSVVPSACNSPIRGTSTRTSSGNRRNSMNHSQNTNANSNSNSSSIWNIDHFNLGKPLGKGKFGNVYMGVQKSSNHPVALKVLMKTSMIASNNVHSLRREVEIQSRLSHGNIVQLYG